MVIASNFDNTTFDAVKNCCHFSEEIDRVVVRSLRGTVEIAQSSQSLSCWKCTR